MSDWKCPDCGSVGTPYVAELDALRAEVERLKVNRDWWMESCQQAQTHRDGANAQLAIAEAEVERLRARVAEYQRALAVLYTDESGDLDFIRWHITENILTIEARNAIDAAMKEGGK